MSDYAIGDIQGCYNQLMALLDHIQFNEKEDRLWFVGDLVNRGPQSLDVLRFIKELPIPAKITLGNHDLHLLALIFEVNVWKNKDDTLKPILDADDRDELGHWLRMQPFLHYDESLKVVMTHAGMPPIWSLTEAALKAAELHLALSTDSYRFYLESMYGNQPHYWSDELAEMDKLRLITNYFTRMRFCKPDGALILDYKAGIEDKPVDFIPWFDLKGRKPIEVDIVFGHWAALRGQRPSDSIYPIDTGCLWGGQLTALKLQDRGYYQVPGYQRTSFY